MLSGHSSHTAILPSAASAVSVTEGQCLVIDVDQLGGVLRLRQRLGDDKGDRFADIAHGALREAEKGASEHRRPVRPLALERYAHDAELGLDKVVAGHDQHDPGRGLRRCEVERTDACMGVRRAQHISVCLAEQVVVVLETAVAAQKALVLETPHRLPDSELAHYLTSPYTRWRLPDHRSKTPRLRHHVH